MKADLDVEESWACVLLGKIEGGVRTAGWASPGGARRAPGLSGAHHPSHLSIRP